MKDSVGASGTDLISVVIPVRNRARLVTEALDSVRVQHGVSFEVIVVDDGSDDGSADAARRIASDDDRITVLERPNGGPSAARNTGVAATRGRWITFLDSDDLMPPGRLRAQLDAITALDQPAIVVGCQEIDIVDGAPTSRHIQQLLAEPGPSHYPMSMIIDRALFDRVGGFAEDMRLDEDREFLYRCRRHGVHLDYVDQVWTIRRIHGDNLIYDEEALDRARFESLRRNLPDRRP